MLWVFIILHLLLYPASNGYNSYFDKDEKSIGGLKNPPPVNKGLYILSLSLDALGLILGYWKVGAWFAVMLFIYGMVSKAYSHPAVRLKKYPVAGWVVTGFFQGAFTFFMCFVGVNEFSPLDSMHLHIVFPAMLTSLMLWGNYPMTQIFQHEEDAARGDNTLSLKLGVAGTFKFTLAVFSIAVLGFMIYFNIYFKIVYALAFLVALTPVLVYFFYWFSRVRKDVSLANYTNTMRLNFISATCLNIFFIWFFLDSSQVLQALIKGY